MTILETGPLHACCDGCSVTKPGPTLHDPMDCSMPGFPVPHHLPEFAQVHVHWISDSIQPSHSLSPSSPSASIFPIIRVFPMSQLFASGGQSTEASASALVLPKSIQDWFPLRLTGLISLLSKGLSRVFSSTTVRKKASVLRCSAFFIVQLSLSIHEYGKDHCLDYMDLC